MPYNIKNPKLIYISTINLDGKIDVYNSIQKKFLSLKREKKPLESVVNTQVPRDVFYKEKKRLTEDFFSECRENQQGCKDGKCFFKEHHLDQTLLRLFVLRTFLHKAIVGCWKFNQKLLFSDLLKKIIEKCETEGRHKKRISSERFDFHHDLLSLHYIDEKEKQKRKTILSIDDIEIKIFSTGSVSIKLKLGFEGEIPLSSLIKFTENPSLCVVGINSADSDDDKSESGLINIFSYEISTFVFNKFFRCLAKTENAPNVDKLKIIRIVPKPDEDRYIITNRYLKGKYTQKKKLIKLHHEPFSTYLSDQANVEEIEGMHHLTYSGDITSDDKKYLLKDFLNEKERFKEKEEKEEKEDREEIQKLINCLENEIIENDAPLYVKPYIGVVFNDTEIPSPNLKFNGEISKVMVSLATQTKNFFYNLREPENYLKTNSLTKGNQDAILIEKRGFAVWVQSGEDVGNVEPALKTAVNTLIFCLESMFATAKSVSYFNKELEEFVSREINNMLTKDTKSGFLEFIHEWSYKQSKKNESFAKQMLMRFAESICDFLKRNQSIPIYKKEIKGGVLIFTILWVSPLFFGSITFFVFFSFLLGLGFLFDRYLKISKLRKFVNTARTLSPCEDFSSNIAPSLNSEIALKGAKKVEEFSLKAIIKTVHDRLENYGHFLKTCQEDLTIIIGWGLAGVIGSVGLLKYFLTG